MGMQVSRTQFSLAVKLTFIRSGGQIVKLPVPAFVPRDNVLHTRLG